MSLISYYARKIDKPKVQLISKSLLGVFTFFKKMNENKSTSSKVELVRSFFGRNIGLKKSFLIYLTLSLKRKEKILAKI